MRRRSHHARWCLALALALAPTLAATGCSDSSGPGGDGGAGDGGDGGFALGESVSVDVTPSTVAFGAVLFGTSETRTLTVTHTGSSGTLVLSGVALLTDSADLTFEPPPATSLGPGQQTTMSVTYTPGDALGDVGTVHIATNAPSASGGTEIFDLPVSTPDQHAELLPDQSLLDFGAVATGASKTRTLILRNLGSVPVTLTSADLTPASSTDFVLSPVALPATLPPGDLLSLDVVYTPSGQHGDDGALSVGVDAFGEASGFEVLLSGSEVSAELFVAPDPVDFGLRAVGPSWSLPVTVSNTSAVPLELSGVAVVATGAWSHTIAVEPFPEEPVVLEGDATWSFDVHFTPVEGMMHDGGPLAALALTSNDPGSGGVVEVLVYGQRLGAGLEVTPPEIVSFGYVPFEATIYREVALYNAGPKPITVAKVFSEGKFKVDEAAAWGPTRGAAAPAELAPGELRGLTLRFSHDGVMETVWGKLTIESDDLARPVWDLLLKAHKVEGGQCLVQLVPSTLDFGRLTPGTSEARTVELVHVGSEACSYLSSAVDDCAAPQTCDVPPDVPPGASTSAVFSVSDEPEPGALLEPGQVLPIEVTFHAPEGAPPEVEAHHGLLRARVESPDLQGDGGPVVTVHPSGASWLNIANLRGEVGIGILDVQPPAVDFGLVKLGCRTDQVAVTATNVGYAALQIQGWELAGCPAGVQVWAEPLGAEPLVVLPPGASVEWALVFEPGAAEPVACALEITSNLDPAPVVVPVVADASYDGTQTDSWTDSAAQTVDVLFVVDDSGSMGQEQANLASSFDAFIQEAASWKSDYQIGVTTTTVSFPDGGGLQGDPGFITAANWEKFLPNVMVGTTGSGTEQGLWAAKISVSPPLTDATQEACADHSDCGFLHLCHLDGTCGGANRGFVREEAALELVFVSDEEDQSPESLDGYLNFFRALKGFDRPDLLHIHAIVGPPGGCSSVNGVADPGHRYLDLAAATGGATYSICELDFAKGLQGIGEIAFAAQMQYFLTAIPAPTTLVVTIEGQLCPLLSAGIFNWVYEPETHSVTLTEEGICSAAPGDLVEITYELLCFAEAGPTE